MQDETAQNLNRSLSSFKSSASFSLTAFLVALLPVGICLAYIFGFRQGKPPGYDRDCFEHWFSGGGFAPEVQTTCNYRHPLSENQP